MFPEGVREPHPARLRSQIYLGRQCRGDSQCPVLPGTDFPEFLYALRIKGSGETDAVGPFGYGFACNPHKFSPASAPMPGIRTVIGRNPEAGIFRKGLHPVIPAHRSFRIL